MTEITQKQKTELLKIPGFKAIQKQFAKEQKQAGAGKKRIRGNGFWESVGDWFSQAATDVNQFLKDTKIVSNIAAYALPILGAMGGSLLTVNPLGATAGGIAGKSASDYIKSQGYGSKMKIPKIRGGELSNKLVINPPGQRLMGRGNNDLFTGLVKTVKCLGKGKTFGLSGVLQESIAPKHSGIMKNINGSGSSQSYKLRNGLPKQTVGFGGIPYGSISSDFGNVRFA
jgi:hypothetical protein